MKKIVLILALSLSALLANDIIDKDVKHSSEPKKHLAVANDLISIERSGCCSWHGGVSGCSGSGRVVCNDGTLSPSCTCLGGEPVSEVKTN